jgi:serine protease Do
MDNNEHIFPEQNPDSVPQRPVQNPSPFVNSPYMMPPAQAPYRPYNPAPAAPPVPPAPQPPQATPKEPEKTGVRGWHLIITAGAMLVVTVAACVITGACVNRFWRGQMNNLTKSLDERVGVIQDEVDRIERPGAENGESISGTPNQNPLGSLTPAQVYAQNVQSVVAIECVINTDGGQGLSSGSGFVMSADGYVITNYHVVEGASKRTVVMSNGTEYEATFIGGDEANDIALLKIEASDLRPVKIGVSDNLIVGDQVVAIGNPLGELASTLTVGYISAKDRIVATDGSQINMLQTDAAINPGNSGGPLFNMNGEVIGITSAKYSGLTSSGATIEGIGFAIPMDDVYDMLDDLRQYGYITGGYLGVSVSDVDMQTAELYGIPYGALVHSVDSKGCAAKAGMKKQDIITNVGGYKVSNLNDLSRALRKFDAGDEITITVYRNGGDVILNVTLDAKPASTGESTPSAPEDSTQSSSGGIEDWFDHFFG